MWRSQAFLKLDKDRSAYITAPELNRVFGNAGIAVSDQEMQALVAKYDKNGDGRLDVSELSKLLEGGARFGGHINQRTVLSPAKPAKRARA